MKFNTKKVMISFLFIVELFGLVVVSINGNNLKKVSACFGVDELLTADGDLVTIDRQPEEVAERVGEDVWCPLLDLDEGSYIVRVVYRAADTGNKLVFSREKGYYKEYDSILSDFAELPRGNPDRR